MESKHKLEVPHTSLMQLSHIAFIHLTSYYFVCDVPYLRFKISHISFFINFGSVPIFSFLSVEGLFGMSLSSG